MKNVTFTTASCATTDGAYVKASNYATTHDYDRRTDVYTTSSTVMTPKSGYNIAYAAYLINTSGTITINWSGIPRVYKITLDDNGGTGGDGVIYECYGKGFYADYTDGKLSVPITSVHAPAKTGNNSYTWTGYWKSVSGDKGTAPLYVTPDQKGYGTLPSPTTFTADTVIHAGWEIEPIPDTRYTVEHYFPIVNAATGAESYSTTPSVKNPPNLATAGTVIQFNQIALTGDEAEGNSY